MTTLVGVRRALSGLGVPQPTFWLPFKDLGAGQVDTSAVRAFPGTAATFVRATSATCWSSAGLLLTVATGIPRSSYTPLTGATYLGGLFEEARTNEVLWNRDATNAAWVKVNTTAAKDQTGIDGAANAASSLIATAGNGTTLQVITEASSTRTLSVFIKRLIGTGEIDITENGGTAWTDVTSLINSSTYSQVTLTSAALNPSVGFRIVTSGDKIAFDYVQNEVGASASTPIATTTVAVTRNIDNLSYVAAGNFNGALGAAYAEVTGVSNAASVQFIGGSSGTPLQANAANLLCGDGATSHVGPAFVLTTTPQRIAASWQAAGSRRQMFLAGVPGTASTNFDGDISLGTSIFINSQGGTGGSPNGTTRNLKIWTVSMTDAQLAAV